MTPFFHPVLLAIAVNNISPPNNEVWFFLLQAHWPLRLFLPVLIFAALFLFPDAALVSSSPPHAPLQRACDSWKTLYHVLAYSLLPHPIPRWLSPLDTLLKCNPSQHRHHPRRCNAAICGWCCGADNSLFYLPLSSTKGPWHWSNASRLMAAQHARDTA